MNDSIQILDERFNSNYSLVRGEREIPLYLKVEVPTVE
jgi:hypothetical protein